MTRAALPRGSRIVFVADGRSPIARNWIEHFVARGDEVHLVSTFPCGAGGLGLASLHVVPVAFARFAGANAGGRAPAPAPAGVRGAVRRLKSRAVSAAFPTAFGWLGPATLGGAVRRLRAIVGEVNPAVVHAMRIPFEGILAAEALEGTGYPLVMSVWGNDLELWAQRYPLLGRLTRRALARATALHPDCARDLRLAERWGWAPGRPSAVLPGNGGIRREVFGPGAADPEVARRHGLPEGRPVVLNPRGPRSYVRNDTFFRSVPLVLERRPDTVFAALGMQDDAGAQRWVRELGIGHAVRLLPRVGPAEMASLFRLSAAAVSPSEFDGTPNTLLEAMACGAVPVAGDIASVREWIQDGVNGLLFDPSDAAALAEATDRVLRDEAFRRQAQARNEALIASRADYGTSMARAEALYAAARSWAAEAGAGGSTHWD